MSTPIFEKYYNGVLSQMKAVMENELDKIELAAQWMAEAVKKDQLIHVYGTGGHNFMIACELFMRAGSLLNYNLILPGGTPCFESHPSTENIPQLIPKAFDYYRVQASEIMLIINVNGINGTTIESAMECRKRGLKCIGISSKRFAENVEPDCGNRHPSGKNLHELVDLHLDCYTRVFLYVSARIDRPIAQYTYDRPTNRTGRHSRFFHEWEYQRRNAFRKEIEGQVVFENQTYVEEKSILHRTH
jgi:uncharacterized phosphosugar-binding protein